MNYIFSFFLLSGLSFFLVQGKGGEIITVITDATTSCGSFILKLLFLTAFFSGMIQIGEDAGVVSALSNMLSPFLKRIFKTRNPDISGKISVNISANLMGIGNAATPSGLSAMKALDAANNHRETPSDDMCLFILFNTCSIQLIPTTILGLRAMAGSQNPASVVLPVILVSFCSLLCGISLCKLVLWLRTKRSTL